MKHQKNYLSIISVLLAMFLLTFASYTKAQSNRGNGDESVGFGLFSTHNGHEYVDLGLSVKWATCNVGANTPEEYGDYFAWGETTPKSSYTKSNYTYSSNPAMLPLSADAANYNWGGSWRMPTEEEIDELIDENNCTWTWTTQNGVAGYKVTSKKNGKSIFLPAAGFRSGDYLSDESGKYWSSSLHRSYSRYASFVFFYSDGVDWSTDDRYYGQSVRAVCE